MIDVTCLGPTDEVILFGWTLQASCGEGGLSAPHRGVPVHNSS